MTFSPGKYSAFVLLIAILVILAALGGRSGIPGKSDSWPPEYLVNRIAVVSADGKIRSLRPDGLGERFVSDEPGFFTWPTWSPDGRSIAYSGVVENKDGEPVTTLFLQDTATSESRALYESVPGFAGLLAEGVVHYPLWSPDGSKLAFIAATVERGLTLFLDDVRDDEHPAYILDQGPLWMSWSSDSTKLAVHRDEDHFVISAQDVAQVSRTSFQSYAYRVPAWMPGRDEFNAVRGVAGPVFALYSVSHSGNRILARVGPNAAFLWSRDGSHLAIADDVRPILYRGTVMFVYRQFRIFDSEDLEETIVVNDNLVSLFWAPNSSKIAYVTLADPSGGMRWTLLDIASGENVPLVDFRPSTDQLTMFQFFDQYAYSHQLWSPDSRYMLFAGWLNEAAVAAGLNEQSDEGSHVFIVDTSPMRSVQPLTEGVLGFWSPI